jgi:hypothetical protein
MPYYASTTCYQKEYPWGVAIIREPDLLVEELPVRIYINVNDFPLPIIKRVINGYWDNPELDGVYVGLIEASFKLH